jgi:hypothetical protein
MNEPGPEEDRTLPTSLRAVAYLAILFGTGSLIHVVVGALHGALYLNTGVLQIPAGFGLLRLSRGWRTYHLVCLWLAMILLLVATAGLLSGSGRPVFGFLGTRRQHVEKETVLLFLAVAALYVVWQYRVLTSLKVRMLFGVIPPPG